MNIWCKFILLMKVSNCIMALNVINAIIMADLNTVCCRSAVAMGILIFKLN